MVTLLVDSGQPRLRTSSRSDLVTVLLGLWFVGGLMVDVWAHNNVPELETFFTPWHAAFYSGFAATGLWICWLVWRNFQDGRRGTAAVPRGYLGSVIALPVFAAFGFGDFIWHTVFGIEQNLSILFSPTHVGLIVSMMVIVTAPLRAAWSDSGTSRTLGSLLPAILAVTFATTLILLFMQYANAFTTPSRQIVIALSPGSLQESAEGVSYATAFLMSRAAFCTILVVAPLLLVARRWRLPFGTATILVIPLAGLSGLVAAFENLPTMLALILAGVLIDLLALRVRPTAQRRLAFWGFGALIPLVIWTLIVATSTVVEGTIPTEPELWTGMPLVMAMVGLGTAVVLQPRQVVPQPQTYER